MGKKDKKQITPQTVAAPKPPVTPPVVEQAPNKPPRYVVAEGKSIACKKGILGPGEVVHPEYVQKLEDYDKLKQRGYLVQEKNFGKKK